MARASSLGRFAVVAATLAACTSTPYRPSPTATASASPPAVGSASPAASATSEEIDGDRLVVLGTDGNLMSMAPDGSAVVALTSDASVNVRISQPVASPDGRYLAWAEVRADRPSIVTATRAGEIRDEIPVRIAPFFLQWDPTSTRIAYLGGLGIGIGFGVIDMAIEDPKNIVIGGGSPLYLSWSPDGTELLVHVGSDTLGRTDMEHDLKQLDDLPGTFQAPAWLPDGRTVFDRVDHGVQELVVADGSDRRVLARFRGGVAFEPSPDGSEIAYRLQRPDGTQTGLYVQDIDGGDRVSVTRDETTAFFWSPRGDALLLMTPEPDATADLPVHRWRVWANGRTRFVSEPFLPSPTFFDQYVPFFDQYAQALTPWSPDGTAFTYAGLHDGTAGIWVQPVDGQTAPVLAGDGAFAMWSPPPT